MPSTDRRQQLIEVALDVFAQRGFAGATTKEIARAAGVTEAIVFRHFPTKQDLYRAVLNHATSECEMSNRMAGVDAAMARNDDAGVFAEIARLVLEGYSVETRYQRTMLFAALEGHELGLEHYRGIAEPVAARWVGYIERRQREGAIRPCKPLALLCVVAGAAQQFGMMSYLFGFQTGVTDETAVRDFIEIILKGAQA